ncbi:hypothetical protein SEA_PAULODIABOLI_323 [Microbacterium phage PauloDiaboli]|nr:hypothetical protein SEA_PAULODIABOLI_323 [Microbacterium phage PauloDiaboli]
MNENESYAPKTPLTHPANRRVKSTTFTPSGHAPQLNVYEGGKFLGTEKRIDGETVA